MLSPRKKMIAITVSVIIALAAVGIYFYAFVYSNSEISAKILDYDRISVCTQNIPPSSCGPYGVTIETTDGERLTYEVAGFDDGNSGFHNEISSKIADAKEKNVLVIVEVNGRGEIVDIR